MSGDLKKNLIFWNGVNIIIIIIIIVIVVVVVVIFLAPRYLRSLRN